MKPAQESIAREFGRRMKAARESRELGQAQVARDLGIGRPTLSNIENGRDVGKKFRPKLASVFEAEADDLHRLLRDYDRAGRTTYTEEVLVPDESIERLDVVEMFHRKRNVHGALAGTWFAMWETTVEGREVPNTEELELGWKGDVLTVRNLAPSAENPKGGYLWVAKMELFDNAHLLGRYIAVDPSVRSKGTLFLTLHNSGQFMYGRWVGCNYDSEIATGMALFSRDRALLEEEFSRYCRSDAQRERTTAQPKKGDQDV